MVRIRRNGKDPAHTGCKNKDSVDDATVMPLACVSSGAQQSQSSQTSPRKER